jgi:hypothetical protein
MEKIANAKLPTSMYENNISQTPSSNDHWIPFSERTEITGVIVVPKDRTGWQPTQLPRPTYATAPKAVPSKRIIDLTSPGEWSAKQEQEQVIPNSRDEVFDLIALEEKNDRAVNE